MYIDHKTRKGIMRGEEEILREGKIERLMEYVLCNKKAGSVNN